MRIATWNVNSVRARLERLLPWLADARPEVVCLQELKCQEKDFPAAAFDDLGYQAAAYCQKTYNGVAILSRVGLEDVERGCEGDAADADRRVITATAGGLRVVNAYVVNGQEVGSPKYAYKLAWMARFREHVARQQVFDEPLVVAGDFNVTFDDRDVYDPEAWREKILCSTPERAALAAICGLGLRDAFRLRCQEGGHYTWWDFRTRGFERKMGLRIDHFLVAEHVAARVAAVEIDLAARAGPKPSDHAPVLLTFDREPSP